MPSPLELLTPDPDRKPSFLHDKWNPLMCCFGGFALACYMNWATRRPVFSGIQRHVGFAAVGGVVGRFFDLRRDDYFAEKDAVLRHYIELHPDDFPTPERKKFADILTPWAPIR